MYGHLHLKTSAKKKRGWQTTGRLECFYADGVVQNIIVGKQIKPSFILYEDGYRVVARSGVILKHNYRKTNQTLFLGKQIKL
jgi:hypothetical protein